MPLNAPSALATGISINPGDMVAKINTPSINSYPANAYNTIVYRIVTGGNCPVGSCLSRQVSPASPLPAPAANEIVAIDISHLSFSYLIDGTPPTETTEPAERPHWLPQYLRLRVAHR